MPWREAIRDPDFQKATIGFLTQAFLLIVPVLNHMRIKQLQDHVRCDAHCRDNHHAQVKRLLRRKRR